MLGKARQTGHLKVVGVGAARVKSSRDCGLRKQGKLFWKKKNETKNNIQVKSCKKGKGNVGFVGKTEFLILHTNKGPSKVFTTER